MTVYSTMLEEVMINQEPQAWMLSPVKSVNVRESLELLLTLTYMSDYNKEMLQEVWRDQHISSFGDWLSIKNDRDYLHPIEKKPGLFVRFKGRFIYKFLSVETKVPLAEISFCICATPVIICGFICYADLDSLVITAHLEVIHCSDQFPLILETTKQKKV